MQRMYGNEETL